MNRGDRTAALNALAKQVKGIALSGGKKKLVKDVKADVISFSGCRDIQTSSDTVVDGEATGAMSYALRMVLDMEQDTSYQQLLIGLRMFMKMKGYSQTPQLSSSHPMDMRLKFIM
ncbi:Ca(2+)-dependent cysteine protease [Borealophlyctis nickersoniae]|nr:Ca(2+)-dependent cysteine protease [Borealophlyctis nickersoniae]